jgi:uncharacterized protein involved in exopolysaccharide biosynthesis
MNDEINLMDFIGVIIKRWYIIALSVIVLLFVLWVPQLSKKEVYEAKAALVLKSDTSASQSAIGGLSSLLGLKAGAGGSFNFPTILASRAVAEIVLDKLDLQHRIKGWDKPDVKRQDLISAVQKMAKYDDKDGLFEITAVTEDPQLSADLANGFAAAGAEYWAKLNYTEARKKREYIEGQLPRVEASLGQAESTVKKFTMIAPGDAALQTGDLQSADLQGVEMKRLERELDIQGTTYIMLRKEYEEAKLDEAKELEPFSMIDPAEKPLKPVKGKLILNFAIALVLGTLGGTALAFGVEALNKMTIPDQA